ncbi:uncharacterized protein G2W53_003849 [Senna tora]|uniref:Uncharacterized protein n=1 Tax=Senna tora TaxID=362788 RepID=A0A834XAZ7_9FABA|nr:uncharacterized protein G2W53_003849 [Senna tora]
MKEALRDMHEYVIKISKKWEKGKVENDPIKWSDSWNRLEKSLFSQAKRDEEERLEVKDIPALNSFKNKI